MKTTISLKPTGSVITIEDVYIGSKLIDVPVMMKGKPTKRTKKQWVDEYKTLQARGYAYGSHEIFILDWDLENPDRSIGVYKADGSPLTGNFQFGRTGKANHVQALFFSAAKSELFAYTSGWDGPVGVGAGAYLKSINW